MTDNLIRAIDVESCWYLVLILNSLLDSLLNSLRVLSPLALLLLLLLRLRRWRRVRLLCYLLPLRRRFELSPDRPHELKKRLRDSGLQELR